MKHSGVRSYNFLFLFFCFGLYTLSAQQLTKEDAVRLMLENNFGILIAENNLEIAKNNKTILNSGYLPTLTGEAGANYQRASNSTEFPDELVPEFSSVTGDTIFVARPGIEIIGAETQRYDAGLNFNYTLFDGLGRFYNYKQLKEQYNLTELQARETIENTMLQLFSVYYEVARLTENLGILEETLKISQKRVTRAEYQFEYGQNTKLGVLNAQVDVANDSINLLNIRQQLANTKRDLNTIINEDLQRDIEVDTTVFFIPELTLNSYKNDYLQNNVILLQNESNTRISEYDVKVSTSGYLPVVGLNGSYGWNQSRNPARAFFPPNIGNETNLNAGIRLTWNLFDGGGTITRAKNAKIALDTQQLLKKQIEDQIERDIGNAIGNFENRLTIYQIQQQNVLTNENNFTRSEQRFKLGQITSIEFRQAQINLMNAKTNKNLAKYDAKLAELELLQLTGQLLNIEL